MRVSLDGWNEDLAHPFSEVAVRTRAVACLVSILVTLGACDSMREMGGLLKDLQALQTGLSATFHEPGVTVNVNNTRYLTVIFVNAANATQPEETRAGFAHQVAEYVRDHYPRYKELTSIAVGFRRQAGIAGFSMSSQQVPYQFAAADLGPAPTVTDTTAGQAAGSARQPSN